MDLAAVRAVVPVATVGRTLRAALDTVDGVSFWRESLRVAGTWPAAIGSLISTSWGRESFPLFLIAFFCAFFALGHASDVVTLRGGAKGWDRRCPG